MQIHHRAGSWLAQVALALLCALQPPALAGCPPNSCCKPPEEPGKPACEKEAADPVNVTSGNHFQREVDMQALPGVLGLELVRNYNSDAAYANERGILGRGWRLSYEEELRIAGSGNLVTALLGDGTHKRYVRKILQPRPDVTVYEAAQPGEPPLRALRSGLRTEYRLVLEGNTHVFDEQRKLVAIVAPTGESLSLLRDGSGALVRVTDPQGRSLSFSYPSPKDASGTRYLGVQHIDTPVGRFRYTYGSAPPQAAAELRWLRLADLVGVALPTHFQPEADTQTLGGEPGVTTSTLSRIYHYEDARRAGMMTGISVRGQGTDGRQTDERVATWAHDRNGRTVLSVRGPFDPAKPGIEQVTLRYEALTAQGGTTVLTNSLGHDTRYTFGEVRGAMQVLEVRGAGCSSCGPVNVRYRYDDRGRLAEVVALGSQGQPLSARRTAYDGVDRPIAIGTVPYLNGKPGEVRWQVHYGYGDDIDDRRPVRIIRPSVVPEQEHRLEITYNEAGQPLQIRERGFRPVDDQGQVVQAGVPIERTIRYSYVTVHGRSLLHTIDGPWPNGPKGSPEDSDITRFTWDARGDHVESIELPMGRRRRIVRDLLSGLITDELDEMDTRTKVHYGVARLARPATVERGGQVLRFAYDALGQVTRVDDGSTRAIQLERDAAGQLLAVLDAQGNATRVTRDTEGLARRTALHEPKQDKPLRATYRWFDALGRPIHQLQPDGRLDSWAYEEDGTLEHIDGDDVKHFALGGSAPGVQLDLSPDGRVRLTPPPSAVPPDDPSSTLSDDFGRIVRVGAHGQGTRVFLYGPGSQPRELRLFDKHGAAAGSIRLDHDAAGRLVRKSLADASGRTLSELRRTYTGARLSAEEDETQAVTYSHDGQGRVTHMLVAFKDDAGRVVQSLRTQTTFDAQTGQPTRLLLADGRTIHVVPDAATGVTGRVELQSVFWSWLRPWLPRFMHGWLPRDVLLADLQFHPFDGITGYAQGNGLRTTRSFDIAGRLTAVKTPGVQDERLAYGVGPRIHQVQDLVQEARRDAKYSYTGFGALQQPGGAGTENAFPQAASRLAKDGRGRFTSDGRFRYAYTLDGQVESVGTPGGRPLARYRYNSAHQRVSKTVWPVQGGPSRTTYFLWQAGHVAAEIEGSGEHAGEVSAQYLYLSDGQNAAPIAKLESAHAAGNATGRPRTLFIHTNHRSEPVAMTDAEQRVVWRGRSDPLGHMTVAQGPHATAILNLRLPGQYFDEETGLHDNWHRSYDPRPGSPLRGRYLSPDPIGYPDGPDPYLYAQGDPVNRVDPAGLYQIDVHYYATFFLAVAAGMDKEDARIVALAAQYIDVNDVTRPIKPGSPTEYWDSVFINQPALERYHFTQAGHDPPRTLAEITYQLLVHKDYPGYVARRILNPDNPQLSRLESAYAHAPNRCARLQLFGEYLHAFEDTFAHRDMTNDPYSPVTFGLGLGHLVGGESPDYTYNSGLWQTNFARTIEMEKEVFFKMVQLTGTTQSPVSWERLAVTMNKFNGFTANESSKNIADKLKILTREATRLNLELDFAGAERFDVDVAAANRDRLLGTLNPNDYPGTILPQGAAELGK